MEESIDEDDEMKESVKELKGRMKLAMRQVIETDERFVAAINAFFGESLIDFMFVLVHDFFHHDYVGESVDNEQVWFVD